MALELPEAQTISSQMDKEIRGKTIKRAWINEKESAKQLKSGMINLAPAEFEKTLSGRKISSVKSYGKIIYVELGEGLNFIIAFETNGKVLYHEDESSIPEKWNTRFDFADGSAITVRMTGWGGASVFTDTQIRNHKYISKAYGSPLSKDFTFNAFNQMLEKKAGKQIKPVLIQQGELISGIGNAYLQDILFKTKIHPKRKIRDISQPERKTLHVAIKKILSEALKLGGREIHTDIYNNPGRYRLLVGKHMEAEPCPECGTKIEKITAAGSASYVCPKCQK
ncbi:hypothetical protein GF359_01855 [candidate division WOR-3 bacterium]|uniref:DNA-(apurinic or apyrimidinic site) lyase n=1 Tax=candidate division WOR-3 bacterium TaxID=2052148 RepID=A0A9D5K7W3_UNCW3|nr:hypothetical protein [candidate division WOR-3 bacterium]MBD3363938.1 hypothetical protein [candidate division WOR-3 bacterium]